MSRSSAHARASVHVEDHFDERGDVQTVTHRPTKIGEMAQQRQRNNDQQIMQMVQQVGCRLD